MTKYLVTGGAGFIGSHLVQKLLEEGATLRILDDLSTGKAENIPSGIEFIEGTVASPETVRKALEGVDGVFHLAAIASVPYSLTEWGVCHATNLGGTINLIEAIAKSGRKIPFVYASSAAVYGNPSTAPLTIASPTEPISPYGLDKLGGEHHAQIAWNEFGIPSMSLRFFNVYGPRQDPSSPYSGVISIFSQKLKEGKAVTIYGDGEQQRDFIYVKDVVAHLVGAMKNCQEKASIYNVCTGKATTILQLTEVIGKVLDVPVEKTFEEPRQGDLQLSLGDPKHAHETFFLPPPTELEEGLREMFEYSRLGV